MRYEPVIGLEVHIELKTTSKMFCGCPNKEATAPNVNVCPVCLAHPGTLPVPNATAIEMGVRMATALQCRINACSKFDRKNYFYPDLPKGYQISQFDLPVGEDGTIAIEVADGPEHRRHIEIGIQRLHLEEDAAKNIHEEDGSHSLIDYNRSGVPLIELVSKPDLRSPAEAKAYLQEIRLLARTLGVSDADMEKGHLRCDANVSLRRLNDDNTIEGELYNPKTEIKNLNSFRMVERALQYELTRQQELWENNTPPMETTTRGWNDAKGKTVMQRTKEGLAEYRYFPDPDLTRMDLSELAANAPSTLPELPAARRTRLMKEYCLTEAEVKILTEDPALADYVEHVLSELLSWLDALPSYRKLTEEEREGERNRMARLVGPWLLTKWMGILNARKIDVAEAKVTAENFAELMVLIATEQVTYTNALKILDAMTGTNKDPSQIMEDSGFGRMDDEDALVTLVEKTLDEHPAELTRTLAGEQKLLAFFIGILMKETEGRADPGLLRNLLVAEIEARRPKT